MKALFWRNMFERRRGTGILPVRFHLARLSELTGGTPVPLF